MHGSPGYFSYRLPGVLALILTFRLFATVLESRLDTHALRHGIHATSLYAQEAPL